MGLVEYDLLEFESELKKEAIEREKKKLETKIKKNLIKKIAEKKLLKDEIVEKLWDIKSKDLDDLYEINEMLEELKEYLSF